MENRSQCEMKIAQIRVARPTDQLDKIVEFYCKGLGLKKLDHLRDIGDIRE